MRFKMINGISTVKRPKKGSKFIFSASLFGFSNSNFGFENGEDFTTIILYITVYQLFKRNKANNGCINSFLKGTVTAVISY